MSDLAWAVKNGDMEQVKELVEGKVDKLYSSLPLNFNKESDLFHH